MQYTRVLVLVLCALSLAPFVIGQRVFLGGVFDKAVEASANLNGLAVYAHPFGYYFYDLGSGAPNGTVLTSAFYNPTRELFVGGVFTAVDGAPATANLAVYVLPSSGTAAPSTGTWSVIGSAVGGVVTHLLVLSDGSLLVGGNFSSFNGATGSLAKCTRTGVCAPFGGITAPITALAELNSVYVAGQSLTSAGGVTVSGVARCASPLTAPVWSQVATGLCGGDVTDIATLPNGYVYFAGSFTNRGNDCTNPATESVAILEYIPANDTWSGTFNFIFSQIDLKNRSSVSVLASSGDTLFLAGAFDIPVTDGSGVSSAPNVAKWNSLTNQWSALGQVDFYDNLPQNSDPRFNSLLPILDASTSTTTLYVAGYFNGGLRSYNVSANIWAPENVQCSYCPSSLNGAGFPVTIPEVMTLALLPDTGPTPPPRAVASPVSDAPIDLAPSPVTLESLGVNLTTPGLVEIYENRTKGAGSYKSRLNDFLGLDFISWQIWAIVGAAVIVLALFCGIVTNLLCRAVNRL